MVGREAGVMAGAVAAYQRNVRSVDYRVVPSFRRGYAYVGGTVISPNTCYKLCSNGVFYLQSEMYAALCGPKSYY